MDLNFTLHPAQERVYNSEARFKGVAAGRRFGKTYYEAVEVIEKSVNAPGPPTAPVWYVAPTFGLGMEVMWPYLTTLASGFWKSTNRTEGKLISPIGRPVHIKGSDRPETLLGRGLCHCGVDEYASMRPAVWEYVLRPGLSDHQGTATFTGSPDGKNHFYELMLELEAQPDGEAFYFKTSDNPHIPKEEIQHAKDTLSHLAFQRNFMGSFVEGSGQEFKEHQIIVDEAPQGGDVYIAVDLAGYSEHKTSKYTKLDETAIAIVKVRKGVWHVLDIQYGRWNIRETSLRIIRAAQKYRPVAVGIEKGALERAIRPYLQDQMHRLKIYPPIKPVTHGNQKKNDRIIWALQGRMEHRRIIFSPGEYVTRVKEQLLDFPSEKTHDDLIDALAYIDQVAVSSYEDVYFNDNWTPIDEAVGY